MFEIGFQELVLISIIGLLVLGPQRLPKVAAELGKWVGRARRTATQLRRQLEREVELSELQNPPPPRTAPPPPASPAAPTSGEVPPGPGTHADQPAIAEESTAPTIDLKEPPTGTHVPEQPSAAPEAGSRGRVDQNDAPQN
jgi:sec-independent protein translocase protein TatB